MNTQSRIYVTLSPRIRKALELCASLDGSNPASYAAALLSTTLIRDIERSPALRERWLVLEREALLAGNWGLPQGTQQEPTSKQDAAMRGWMLAGNHPECYEYGVEEKTGGKNSGYLKSKEAWEAEGFGTLMQNFKANEYRNKRLRYSALVRAEEVENWAGLWMRVDGPRHEILAFDNMQSRSIKGTADWQRYEIVLDVPQESTKIAFGILLHGSGKIWISDIQFDDVEADIPATQDGPRDQPVNLDFVE